MTSTPLMRTRTKDVSLLPWLLIAEHFMKWKQGRRKLSAGAGVMTTAAIMVVATAAIIAMETGLPLSTLKIQQPLCRMRDSRKD